MNKLGVLLERFHPWNVKNIEDFLFLCCPECEIKTKNVNHFIDHAIREHQSSYEHVNDHVNNVNQKVNNFETDEKVNKSPNCDNENDENKKVFTNITLDDSQSQIFIKLEETIHTNITNEPVEDVKTFRCDRCPKKFKIKYHLTKHKRICTKPRKFDCDTCDTRFYQKSDYTNHLESVHGIVPVMIKCELCDASYTTKTNLKKHLQSVHEKFKPKMIENHVKRVTRVTGKRVIQSGQKLFAYFISRSFLSKMFEGS